jgi:lysophospholipase L1-like esterase
MSRLALLLLGSLGALLLGEGALRVADAGGWLRPFRELHRAREASVWMASDDPALIYRHRPDYTSEGRTYTERSGILQPNEVALAPTPGVFRIVALGDSVFAAVHLDFEDRMLTLLEAELDGAGERPTEVLNFAVNGYDTQQEAKLLEAWAGRFAPDAIVLQYCANDFHPSRYPTRWFLKRPALRWLEILRPWLSDPLIDGYPPASFWEEQYRTDAAGWRRVEDGFARIAGFARERGIPALLVIVPVLSHEGWESGRAAERHARVAAAGRAAGFSVLDLFPFYARHPIESIRFRPWDTFHPNALGHRLAATAMAESLRGLGVPPSPPPRS